MSLLWSKCAANRCLKLVVSVGLLFNRPWHIAQLYAKSYLLFYSCCDMEFCFSNSKLVLRLSQNSEWKYAQGFFQSSALCLRGTWFWSHEVMSAWLYPFMSVCIVQTQQLLMLCVLSRPWAAASPIPWHVRLKTDLRWNEQISSSGSHWDP